ncbi:pyridoxamine 5'-phosphate oxidase family protein [Sulfurimonas sp. SAG-AH-194-I05]|nr:pyridoxamine 5'-phosphate oxidase family protein [Sulfurimonas sp. SAG-AH-194-I05]MDF1875306.1 pyridoxamine 5'-phosphate oxidase family protein [Sulfurimonas sp. SAG-AH-194-I05]
MVRAEENLPGSEGEHTLQLHYKTREKAKEFYDREVYSYITEQMKAFIAKQKMMFIATSDKHGECDSSLRTAQTDFVLVLDEKRLVYPEFNGNGVMASLGNISENPNIGLLFVDFFENQVGLHVNGKASIVDEADEQMEAFAKRLTQKSVTWVLVEVEEAYIHCSKNIPLLAEVE